MVKKVKSQAKSRAKPKEQAEKLLAKVPEEYVFWCQGGRIFRDMKELAEGLVAMSDETFAYHSNSQKNDFSEWVRNIIQDEKLASDLAMAISRAEAAGYVVARLDFLTRKLD